jgi:CcmD family protein
VKANLGYLFAAYAAVWIGIFVYVLRLAGKSRDLEAQLEDIRLAVTGAEPKRDGSSETSIARSSNGSGFASQAARGPADCRIAIKDWLDLHDELARRLIDKGASNTEIVDLLNDRLIGVCPRCHTWTAGQGLSMLSTTRLTKATIFTGNTGGMERLVDGLCRNYDCPCTEILIFWKPDEDRDAVARLGSMGVRIKPRY